MAYCTSADVGVLLQQDFNENTQPTAVQVDSIIEQTTGEIDSILLSKSVSLPISDSTTLQLMKKYCSFGSACTTGFTYFRNNESVNDSQPNFYCNGYKEFLEQLKTDPESIIGTLDMESVVISSQVLDGSYTEDEIDEVNVDQDFEW